MRLLLIVAMATMGAWIFMPGSQLDRLAFGWIVRGFINPPLFISGEGSHAVPWKLGSMTSHAKPDQRQAPVIVSLGDDLEGFFQTSPPAPIDVAVIFSNFYRLGAKKAATAVVLAWETPDPIGLVALDQALGQFDSLVMAAPLSRAVVSSPLPASFRRASLPLTAIIGDVNNLPVINRIPVPGVILGGENSLAGFSFLESEPATPSPPLVARWQDRVVFAFPLLTVLQRSNLPLDGMEIHLGKYIKLSPTGPIVPLDKSGRLEMPVKSLAAYKEISAEALIDGGDDLFPKAAPDPVILRDDRSSSEPATRAFSASLSGIIAATASNEAYAQTREYPRLPAGWEIAMLALTVLALFVIFPLGDFGHHLGLLVLSGLILTAQWIGVGIASHWLPGLPALAAVLTAFCVSKFSKAPSSTEPPKIEAAPPSPVEITIALPSTPQPKEKKPRAPRAKKIAPVNPTAKKAATPRKPRAKKPPAES